MSIKTEESRTQNFIRNSAIGIITQLLSLILSFACRTIFIKLLSNDYLSINGLFSNILSMLSFVELGFGTALLYMMYSPVANKDYEKIKTYTNYYKRVYYLIGTTIFILGILIIPFLKYIIKEPPVIEENIIIIYIIFLINTCIGYFYSHKTTLLIANQKNYIISIYSQLFKWIQIAMQIVVLVVTKNYILYLLIQTITTILNNMFINRKANKMYPYIKEKNINKMTIEEKKNVNKKVRALVLYKLGPSILSGSDNIILSACVGITYVGKYSNYYLITNYLSMFLNQITSSFEVGVGNLNVNSSNQKKEEVFYNMFYICFIIYGFSCVMMLNLINEFINIWIGKEFLFNGPIVFSILLYIYINGMCLTCHTFRTTTGLFEKEKIAPLLEIVINIASSIILAKKYGVIGVFLGTSIAKILTFFWNDPRLIYKHVFENDNVIKYFIKFFKYTAITAIICFITMKISSIFTASTYAYWILKSAVIAIVTIFLFIIFTYRTAEFEYLYQQIKEKIKKVNKEKK